MRKIIAICILILLLVNLAPNGYCQDAIRKLGRGVSNIVGCPLEIPKSIYTTYKERGVVDSIGLGLPKGLVLMVVRLAMGGYEVFTFPVPIPEGYEPTLSPEFPWQ